MDKTVELRVKTFNPSAYPSCKNFMKSVIFSRCHKGETVIIGLFYGLFLVNIKIC